jgi:protoporphyrinogen oxidase
MRREILVVGAGLAGIFTAYKLSMEGYDVLLVEKSEKLGGLLRTIQYVDSRGNLYFFDLGPHIPPRNETWRDLCKKVDNVKLQYGLLKSSLRFGNYNISFPVTLKDIINIPFELSLKLFKSYLESLIVKRNEANVEDCLINKFGATFYRDYLRNYIYKFWKLPPNLISKDFKLRVPSLSLKSIIRSLISTPNFSIAKTNSSSYDVLYPKYGIGQVIKPIINEIVNNNVEIKLGTIVKHISPSNGKLFVRLKEPNSTTEYSFNNVIWTGSICDISKLFGLTNFRKLNYRKLLLVNCAIEKEDLLGEGVVDSYIMSPETVFHRVYEPKKFSSSMAPPSHTSVCIETTVTERMENTIQYIVERSIKQIQLMYNLASSDIRYLGYEIVENAYPLMYVNYENQVNEVANNLRRKNIYLIGRTGHYKYIGIGKVLEEALQTSWEFSKK